MGINHKEYMRKSGIIFMLVLLASSVNAQKITVNDDKIFREVLEEYVIKAKKGDVKSLHVVGMGCYFGKFFEEDKSLGMIYLKRAAENKYSPALETLGNISLNGNDYRQSILYYKKAIIYYNEADSTIQKFEDLLSKVWDVATIDIQFNDHESKLEQIYANMNDQLYETFDFLSQYDETARVLIMHYNQSHLNKEKTTSSNTENCHCISATTNTLVNGHQFVDLGLSVKWATHNIGAFTPEDIGDYFAWGEIEKKKNYTIENSLTHSVKWGNIDGTGNDVAHVKWGKNWRMPTIKEMGELIDNCIWKWVSNEKVNGYLIIGPNGNSIFLPATGATKYNEIYNVGNTGGYWSATSDGNVMSSCIYFSRKEYHISNGYYRHIGYTIRPVIGGSCTWK